MTEPSRPSRKLSRQQLRAGERKKRTATEWISELDTDDPWLRQAIREAVGARAVTRAELEQALGMSLAGALASQER